MNGINVTDSLMRAALQRAAHGWHVLPLHSRVRGTACSCGARCASPAKHPRTEHGLEDATVDPQRIREWWAQWPNANLGIRTGAVSGIVVLDIDGDEGEGALAALLPIEIRTPMQRTGRGRHLVFQYPRCEIKNAVRLLPGCDVRGDNGYVVAPPSVHITGRRYAWADGRDPAYLRPAPLPRELHELLLARHRLADAPLFSSDRALASDETATRARAYIRTLPTGLADGDGRNVVCYRLACFLLRDLGQDVLTTHAWVDEWNRANREPLSPREVAHTVGSAKKHGRRAVGSGIDRPLPLARPVHHPAVLRAVPSGGSVRVWTPRGKVLRAATETVV